MEIEVRITGWYGCLFIRSMVIVDTLEEKIMAKIMYPNIAGLKKVGFLYYAGLMITPDNEPKVLEFNVRLGDPEIQPLMMLTFQFN
ncbi:hypothetical protein [Coxiella-like endosymbiont]|uniref:hypothetical protein n=1 Tax=Coxiella-like endosymbiont TaxID=1592897 RepID=UPI002729E6BE|nr:hypothetical protein [Coxiella-like endosymbiont]